MNDRQQELNSIFDIKRKIEELVGYYVKDRVIVLYKGNKRKEGFFDAIVYKDIGEGEHYYLKISDVYKKEFDFIRMENIDSLRDNFDGFFIEMK